MSTAVKFSSCGASSLLKSTLVLFCANYLIKAAFSGKIRVDLLGVELGDYRFGKPYVIFYDKDYYKGTPHFQLLSKKCSNLPVSSWNASSIDVQKRCVRICDDLDCEGNCAMVHAHPENPNNKGAPRLSNFGMNDKVRSIRYCYPI